MTWAFEFEGQPYFAGLRVLASNGIDLPVLNVFRMFSKMSGERLLVESSGGSDARTIMAKDVREEPDVSALASRRDNELCVLAWHYHDHDVPGDDAAVTLEVGGLSLADGKLGVTGYQIDRERSNAFEAWKRMGSPQQPTPEQYAQLEKTGGLAELPKPDPLVVKNGTAMMRFLLPRQAVVLFVARW